MEFTYIHKRREQICFYLLLGLFIVVPLIFYVRAQNIVFLKPLSTQFLSYTAFLMWMVASYYQAGRFKLLPSPINVPLVLLFLYYVFNAGVTVWRTTYDPAVMEEMARFVAYFLIAFSVPRFLSSHRRLLFALNTIVIITFLVSLYYWGQVGIQIFGWKVKENVDFLSEIIKSVMGRDYYLRNFGTAPTIWGSYPKPPNVSTFGNKNFYTGYVDVTFPICFGMAFATRGYFRILAYLGTGLMTMYCIYHSKTRGAILAMGGSTTLFFLLLLANIRNVTFFKEKVRRWVSIGIVVVMALGVLATAYVKRDALYSFLYPALEMRHNVLQGKRGTNLVRIRMWEGAMRMALDHPILGTGVGSFQLAFPYYRPNMYHRSGVSHNTRHSHNQYLEVISETGVTGLILFLSFYATVFIVAVRLMWKYRKHKYYLVIVGVTCGLVGSLLHNIVSVAMRWTACAVSFWTGVGVLLAFQYLDKGLFGVATKPRRLRNLRRGNVMGIIAVVFIAVYVYSARTFFVADKHLIRGMSLLNDESKVDEALVELKKALDMNPFEISAMYKGAFAYLRKGQPAEADKLYRRLTGIAPNYAQIHNNIGLVTIQLGNEALGLTEFERATTIENNYKNHMALAQRWYNTGNIDKAEYHLFMIHLLDHDSQGGDPPWTSFYGRDAAYLFQSRINYSNRNNKDRAEKTLHRAIAFNPKNEGNYLQLADFYLRDGDLESAGRVMQQGFSTIKQPSFNMVAVRVRILEQLGRKEEARAIYEKSIPELYNRGELTSDQQRDFVRRFIQFAASDPNVQTDLKLLELIVKADLLLGEYRNGYNLVLHLLSKDAGNKEYRLLKSKLEYYLFLQKK